jgi:hypothetical protein
MENIIKKLLREGLSNDNGYLDDPLFIEGLKYFPKLSVRTVATNNDSIEKPRFFKNYSNNKGSFTYNSFKHIVTQKKIELLIG